MRAFKCIALPNEHDGHYEFFALIKGIKNFVPCHRDRARPLNPTLDLDMARFWGFAAHAGRI